MHATEDIDKKADVDANHLKKKPFRVHQGYGYTEEGSLQDTERRRPSAAK